MMQTINTTNLKIITRMLRLHLVIFALIYAYLLSELISTSTLDTILILITAVTGPTAFNIMNNIWHMRYDMQKQSINTDLYVKYLEPVERRKYWTRIAKILITIALVAITVRFIYIYNDIPNLLLIMTLVLISISSALLYNKYGKEIGAIGEVFYFISYITVAYYVIIPTGYNMLVSMYVFLSLCFLQSLNILNHITDLHHEKRVGVQTLLIDLDKKLQSLPPKYNVIAILIKTGIVCAIIAIGLGLYMITPIPASFLYLTSLLIHAAIIITLVRFRAKEGIILNDKKRERRVYLIGRIGSALIFMIAMIIHIILI